MIPKGVVDDLLLMREDNSPAGPKGSTSWRSRVESGGSLA